MPARVTLVGLVAVAALLVGGGASASIEVATDATRPALRVNAAGAAEVSWTDGSGTRRTLLVPPRGRVLPGGRLSGRDLSRPAGSSRLALRRVLRRTPDGRLWALQSWQREQGGPVQLRFARWRGAPTVLTLTLDGDRLRGTAIFQDRPVSGSYPSPEGRRVRATAFIEARRGGGWRRIVGVAPRRDGSFAVLLRPAWRGTAYRATIVGPNLGATYAPDARAVVRAG